jgi:hypothetical protein
MQLGSSIGEERRCEDARALTQLGMAGGGGQQHENQRWGSWRPGGTGGAARWRTYLAGICAVAVDSVLRRARRVGKKKARARREIDGKRRCGDGVFRKPATGGHG